MTGIPVPVMFERWYSSDYLVVYYEGMIAMDILVMKEMHRD